MVMNFFSECSAAMAGGSGSLCPIVTNDIQLRHTHPAEFMARASNKNPLAPTIEACRQWMAKCLIADGSILATGELGRYLNQEGRV